MFYFCIQMAVLFSMERDDDKTLHTPLLSLQKLEEKDFFKKSILALSPDCTTAVFRQESTALQPKNEVMVYDLIKNKTILALPTLSWPNHCILINNEKVAYIEQEDNSVWVKDFSRFKLENKQHITTIRCPINPPLKPVKLLSTSSDLLLILSLNLSQLKQGTLHCWNTNIVGNLIFHHIEDNTLADQIPAFFINQQLITYNNNPPNRPSINLHSLVEITTQVGCEQSLSKNKELLGHSAPINDLALSFQNNILASGSDDKFALIWHLEKQYPHYLLNELPHDAPVLSVTFHPIEPQYILTGISQEPFKLTRLSLWNYLCQEQIAQFDLTPLLGKRSLRWPISNEIYVGSRQHIWQKFFLNFPSLLEQWRAEKNRN